MSWVSLWPDLHTPVLVRRLEVVRDRSHAYVPPRRLYQRFLTSIQVSPLQSLEL